MELYVCIKRVPDDSVTVGLDANGKPATAGITQVVNAFDTYALEMAVRFKEASGGNVTVVTADEEAAVTPLLRSCLAVGANQASVIPAAGQLEASEVAATLAGAIKGAAPDVIFCGSESTDSADTQVGVRLACCLGIPVVTNVLSVEACDGRLVVHQETDAGYRVVEVPTPCVLTVVKPAYEPRYPTMKSKMAARKLPIAKLAGETVTNDLVSHLGYAAPAKRQSGLKIQEKDAAEAVRQAMAILAERKLV